MIVISDWEQSGVVGIGELGEEHTKFRRRSLSA